MRDSANFGCHDPYAWSDGLRNLATTGSVAKIVSPG